MKKIYLLIIPILFSLTGCYNYRELNDLAIVSGISISMTDNQYEVMVEVVNPKKQQDATGSDEPDFIIYKKKANSMQQAFREIVEESPKKLYTAHLNILIIDESVAKKARKWSTQSRDCAPWYQHSETGYNYRMSNIVAGVIRGQIPYIGEHIAQKKKIYQRYKEGFKDLPVQMNPFPENSEPNFWLSCMTVNPEAMCEQKLYDTEYTYTKESGKTCPMEILEAIKSINAEGRPLWKPMHLQPLFDQYDYITASGDTGKDLFSRGLCLPSDNKMTEQQQDAVIKAVRACFE